MVGKNIKETNIPLEWKQQDSNVSIEVLEITIDDSTSISNLLNELCSKNVSFSIKLDKRKQYLVLYSFYTKKIDIERRNELVQHLKNSYSLQELSKTNSIFMPKIKKIEQEDLILKLKLIDGRVRFTFACMLSSINSGTQNLSKKITHFITDLLQAEIFSVVLSYIPSYRKDGEILPMWGMMFISESRNFDEIIRKKKQFLSYLKNSPSKLDCKLTSISKKLITRHEVNFRFYVPWMKHKGLFFNTINVDLLLRSRKLGKDVIENTKTIRMPLPTSVQKTSDKPSLKSVSIFKPFPSVKKLDDKVETPDNKITTETYISTSKNEEKIKTQPAPSNLDDLTAPVPRTMNTTFDAEYLKVRISKIFKEFEFKESVIFEDSFDLVLRKGSFYIFVKFYQDILNQTNAYEIVDTLSSISGLRNDFLCIVVADVIEEGSKNVLHEFKILHLTLNDVLLNDALKTKIYNTILA